MFIIEGTFTAIYHEHEPPHRTFTRTIQDVYISPPIRPYLILGYTWHISSP